MNVFPNLFHVKRIPLWRVWQTAFTLNMICISSRCYSKYHHWNSRRGNGEFYLGKYDVNVFRQWISATQKCNFWSSVLAYTIQIFTCLRSVLGLVNLICCRWHKRHCHQLFISYVSPRQINHTSYSFADFPSELVLILIIVVAIIISLTILTIGIVCIFKR